MKRCFKAGRGAKAVAFEAKKRRTAVRILDIVLRKWRKTVDPIATTPSPGFGLVDPEINEKDEIGSRIAG